MTRQERAKMLAHIWTRHVWPEQGDVRCLSLAMRDDDDEAGGFGVSVYGAVDIDDLSEALVDALLGLDIVSPSWLAMTGTVYFDELPPEEAAKRGGNLAEDPTPTTQHGLMVVAVDKDGVYSTCWAMELSKTIDLPDEPTWEQAGGVGYNVDVLQALFGALRVVAGLT